MKPSERACRFVFQIRGMWKAAGMIYDAQRNVLDMTIELANEIERRIQLEAENGALREFYKAVRNEIPDIEYTEVVSKAIERVRNEG